MSDEVNFLHADKHQSLLQVDTTFSLGLVRHVQKNQAIFQYLCDISKKKLGIY